MKKELYLPLSIIIAAAFIGAGLWHQSEKGRFSIYTGVAETSPFFATARREKCGVTTEILTIKTRSQARDFYF
jgi:hypothetical protein